MAYKQYSDFFACLQAFFASYAWEDIAHEMADVSAQTVAHTLTKPTHSIADLPVLLSPAAEAFLEEMAQKAHRLTLARFGRTVLLYVPLYVSNYCTNRCVYCGFNADNTVERCALSLKDAQAESRALAEMGFQHILLVSGEHPRYADVSYIAQLAESLRHMFSSICVEIQPLSQDDYARLITAGVDCVTCYQETYNPATYAHVHPGGPKHDYAHRLTTLDRAASAGIRKVGLSPLYGLDNWRVEAFCAGLHCAFLTARYWQTHTALSFPRLRYAAGDYTPPAPLSDAGLALLICAFRLCLPDTHLVLSTRERADVRDALLPLGITQMSAASKTAPFGYSHAYDAEPQFAVQDTRTAAEVARAIAHAGYDPVWKDWDATFLETPPSATL